jgi:hypothetical protein
MDPFPSPAKWESHIGAMDEEKEKLLDLHRQSFRLSSSQLLLANHRFECLGDLP